MSIVSQVDQTYPLHGKVGQGQGAVLGTHGQSAQPPCAPKTNWHVVVVSRLFNYGQVASGL